MSENALCKDTNGTKMHPRAENLQVINLSAQPKPKKKREKLKEQFNFFYSKKQYST